MTTFPVSSLRVGFALLCLGSMATADVLDVRGPNPDFHEMLDAVEAASDGDTIRVWPGQYGRFAIVDKDLDLIAAPGQSGLIRINALARVRNLSASKTVRISGFKFRGDLSEGMLVYDNAGQVFLQDCVFEARDVSPSDGPGPYAQPTFSGIQVLDSHAVSLSNCTVSGGSTDDYDDYYYCDEYGYCYDGGWGPGPGAKGMQIYNSRVAVFGGSSSGGDGSGVDDDGYPAQRGDHGLSVSGSSEVWLSGVALSGGWGGSGPTDSSFGGCGGGAHGGHALHIDGSDRARVRGLSMILNPGMGGRSHSDGYQWYCVEQMSSLCYYYEHCGPGADGQSVSLENGGTYTDVSGVARTLAAPFAAFDDEPVSITVTGEPGDLVGLSHSFQRRYTPRPRGVLLLGSLRWGQTAYVGTVPASGVFTYPMPPLSSPALDSLTLGVQATLVDTTGRRHLTEARWITLLDAELR